MITRGLREFVARDWQAARDHKDTYWAERIARLGPSEGLRIADELRRQAIPHDPTWPDAALREADLLAHARLSDSLRRADSAAALDLLAAARSFGLEGVDPTSG